jgi:hypothetical protein
MSVESGWLESPLGMRWSTLALAVAIGLIIGVVRRQPFLAVVAIIAWVGGFEVVYRFFDILRWHEWWAWNPLFWEAAALAGWVALAHIVGIRPAAPWVILTATCFAFWVLSGFDYNILGRGRSVSVGAEMKNVVAKAAWGLMYLEAAWRAPASPLALWTRGDSNP